MAEPLADTLFAMFLSLTYIIFIVKTATALIAIWNGQSKGTKHG